MYYTYMDKVFEALTNVHLKYNWLISNYECNCYPNELIPFGKEYVWITGEKLNQIIFENEIQFIWGVFSAFEKDIKKEDALKYPLPYADGNPSYWRNNFNIQHPLAKIEIVPWDSTLVLIIAEENIVVESFLKSFPLAEELSEYNSRH
ncbi:hypothetical protein F8154_13990 [Alkaliphilus pronyensis]|uniref:DUF2691 family protein n=2 Tax=Alkaliphilus pronyensis TaxID=1482732 RepID=A0A6I0EYI7_9FIRM|nr:hypothetical protein F8154_13990 [Alkaliphilus pronyensis]